MLRVEQFYFCENLFFLRLIAHWHVKQFRSENRSLFLLTLKTIQWKHLLRGKEIPSGQRVDDIAKYGNKNVFKYMLTSQAANHLIINENQRSRRSSVLVQHSVIWNALFAFRQTSHQSCAIAVATQWAVAIVTLFLNFVLLASEQQCCEVITRKRALHVAELKQWLGLRRWQCFKLKPFEARTCHTVGISFALQPRTFVLWNRASTSRISFETRWPRPPVWRSETSWCASTNTPWPVASCPKFWPTFGSRNSVSIWLTNRGELKLQNLLHLHACLYG